MIIGQMFGRKTTYMMRVDGVLAIAVRLAAVTAVHLLCHLLLGRHLLLVLLMVLAWCALPLSVSLVHLLSMYGWPTCGCGLGRFILRHL